MKLRTVQELRGDEVRKQAELIQLRIASATPKFSRQVSVPLQGQAFSYSFACPRRDAGRLLVPTAPHAGIAREVA